MDESSENISLYKKKKPSIESSPHPNVQKIAKN